MGTRLGRYDIIRTLAKGALTDLLLGRASGMEGFQRHVAIKRLREEHATDPACLEMFVNEARLAAALHHHNIVQVLDIGEGDGQPFFAMEYVHGVDLRKVLGLLAKRSEQLPIPHVVSIVASVAAALHHAHEQRGPDGKALGIVHRQVTPGNIIVGFDGNVKIVDFGIAKAAIKRSETGVGVLKGSAPYMAPEQCAGHTIDRRSDVFALGIVLFELSTVRRLFKGANEFLTMSAVVNAEVPRPSQYRRDVPSDLEVVMLKALARDPLARYQTANDMAEALDRVARSVGVGASTTQLANYMKLQFGERKEPWLLGNVEMDPEVTEVDFDGAASGVAPPPTEAVKNHTIPKNAEATRSSPIHMARTSVTGTPARATGLPVPRAKGSTLPPPPRAKGATEPPPDKSFQVATKVDSPRRSATLDLSTDVSEEPPTDVPQPKQRTNVATPPPPPPGGIESIRPRPADMTAIVTPLSVIAARAETIHGNPRRIVWIGGAVAAIALIIGVIVMWPSSDLEPTSTAQVTQADPPPEAETKSALDMTARDYERAKEAPEPVAEPGADAAVADEPPVVEPETKPAVEPETKPAVEPEPKPAVETKTKQTAKATTTTQVATKPAETKPAVRPAPKSTKRSATKPAPKRTPAKKPATAPAKKPAAKKPKPKWNPDDLFLGE